METKGYSFTKGSWSPLNPKAFRSLIDPLKGAYRSPYRNPVNLCGTLLKELPGCRNLRNQAEVAAAAKADMGVGVARVRV